MFKIFAIFTLSGNRESDCGEVSRPCSGYIVKILTVTTNKNQRQTLSLAEYFNGGSGGGGKDM